MRTLSEVIAGSTSYLAQRQIPAARRESEALVGGVLGLSRLELYTDRQRPIQQEELVRLREALVRRGRREPLAYILGSVEFFGAKISVDPRVLIPRPETELLVSKVVQHMPGVGRALDLCTGSGCLAIAMARAAPSWEVYASDISSEALDLARDNALQNGASVQWRRGDLLSPWLGMTFDLIVSNPPYVALSWLEQLDPEVKQEPGLALFAGLRGYDVIDQLAEQVMKYLNPGGCFFMEFGYDQPQYVLQKFRGLGRVTLLPELGGRDRFLLLENATPKELS